MSLYDEVIEWAKTRPWWQQRALARLARGDEFTDERILELARDVFRSEPERPTGGWVAELTEAEETVGEPIVLQGIRNVEHVNRLKDGQELSFSEVGLTVVFGQNGSGKSGYARIIQSMVRTRQRATILPDVFGPKGGCAGELAYKVGAESRTQALDGEPPVELARAAFYDEHTGDDYLTHESEVLYRPALLKVLDDLVRACDQVRAKINEQRAKVDAKRGPLPSVADESASAAFLAGLSAETADAAIEARAQAPDGADETLVTLQLEEARLRITNPVTEKQRLNNLAAPMNLLASHLDSLSGAFSAAAGLGLATARASVETTRAAAALAAQVSFDGEPLPGIGRAAWRTLWESAANYSAEAYPDRDFPHTHGGAVCVLCQQPIEAEGADRLKRFAAFVADDTATRAARARRTLDDLEADIRGTEIEPPHVVRAVAALTTAGEPLGDEVDRVLGLFDARKSSMLVPAAVEISPIEATLVVSRLRDRSTGLSSQASVISADSFTADLNALLEQQRVLRDAIAMRDGVDLVRAERDRLRKRRRLDQGFTSANTRAITEKIAQWTKEYVTEASRDWFTRETDRLALERVTLRETPPRKGVLYQRPAFVSAAVTATLREVLSEGEQTALGLAGFLTEAHLDQSRSALILDDPVTSLDHVRRDRVADRIVEFAQDRQVIVFTHDSAFTADLRRACEARDVQFTERSVSRSAAKQPGFTSESHPWTVKNAAARMNDLQTKTARLAKNLVNLSDEEYTAAVRDLAGAMSETWERIISQEIAERLVDHKTLNVQPKMMKVIAQITPGDEAEFQESYGRISGWAPRHDNHPDMNWTAPDIEEVKSEVDTMKKWFDRVQKYKSTK